MFDNLQRALYVKLIGTAAVTSRLSTAWGEVAVFEDTPQENADVGGYYPFVSFGAETLRPFDTKDSNGINNVCQIDVWTRDDMLTCKAIGAAIYDALHKQPITITGADHVLTSVESVQFVRDPDGHTRHGIMLVRFIYDNV